MDRPPSACEFLLIKNEVKTTELYLEGWFLISQLENGYYIQINSK